MYKKILMAYNGTHEGRIALFECAEVASFVKAETHLLAVGTPSMSMFVEGFEGTIPEQGSAQAQKLMKNVLAEGLAALTQRGYSVTGHLAVGEPVAEICRLASELKCDLIVVGHKRKHSRLGRWWRGSISANLADHAPCSILIAMAPTGASYAIGQVQSTSSTL
jgi:nucleotide-binding universal stress UspA family protein